MGVHLGRIEHTSECYKYNHFMLSDSFLSSSWKVFICLRSLVEKPIKTLISNVYVLNLQLFLFFVNIIEILETRNVIQGSIISLSKRKSSFNSPFSKNLGLVYREVSLIYFRLVRAQRHFPNSEKSSLYFLLWIIFPLKMFNQIIVFSPGSSNMNKIWSFIPLRDN